MFITTTSTSIKRRALGLTLLAATVLATACGNSRDAAGPDTTETIAETTEATDSTVGGLPLPDGPDGPDDGGDGGGPTGNDSGGGSGDDGSGDDGSGSEDPGPGQPDDGGEAPDNDGGGGTGDDMDPTGENDVPVPGPCDDVLATGAVLLVGPAPAVLPSGTLTSDLTVTNCGSDAVDWTADTIPGVALAQEAGNLTSGASTAVGFTIDAMTHGPGAIEFKIKVSEPGHNHYVDVQAFRDVNGSDFAGDLGLATGPSAGCSEQCVVSALLTANVNTPDVDIAVTTNVPAMINVYVSTWAPGEENGHPAFNDGGLKAFSNGFVEQFSANLDALQPATDYHLILEAIDEHGQAWYGTTEFRTITPLDLPDQIETPDGPAGCYAQCITAATVHPQGTGVALHVETHTSALLSVWVSTEPFALDEDDRPILDATADVANTDGLDVTVWDTVLADLEFDTDYHIVVEAADLGGGRSYRIGTFHTADGAQVTAHFWTVAVVDDADSGDNPGEVSMAWGYDGMTLGTRGEQQLESGTTVVLDADNELTFTDSGGFLPMLNVTLHEYDDPGITEACPGMYGVWTDWGGYEDCGLKVNVATSGIYDAGIFDSLPRCSDFGLDEVADQPCMVLEAPSVGGDHPVFWAVVSFEYVS